MALGWRIDQEGFMESTAGWLNDLKLRLGWGETGQQAVGSYYNYIPIVTHRNRVPTIPTAMAGG